MCFWPVLRHLGTRLPLCVIYGPSITCFAGRKELAHHCDHSATRRITSTAARNSRMFGLSEAVKAMQVNVLTSEPLELAVKHTARRVLRRARTQGACVNSAMVPAVSHGVKNNALEGKSWGQFIGDSRAFCWYLLWFLHLLMRLLPNLHARVAPWLLPPKRKHLTKFVNSLDFGEFISCACC